MTTPEQTPERKLTDESLAGERSKVDDALNAKIESEQKADVVLDRARDDADDVVATARAEADDKRSGSASSDRAAAIEQQRDREDGALEAERVAADETLSTERAESSRLLARLLPLERDKTDQYLRTERARSDDAVANRDDFLSMVSHDLRDLLGGIVLSAHSITRTNVDRETSTAMAERIQRSAGRMSRLIGDLLDIASIDAGKLAVVATESDATAVILEAVETWLPPAAAKGIALETAQRQPVRATFDHARALQILGNLITNAVKFSASGTTVVVGVDQIAGEARFWVKDQGSGIASDQLEAIFDRFSQVGKNDRRGLGLGLYISKCLVEAQGGTIWAESTLGSGTTVFFTVPAASASSPHRA